MTDNLTINLQSGELAIARRKAYVDAAKRAGKPITVWMREVCDKAAGFDPDRRAGG